MNHLKVRSCLIDGELVCCDEKGVTSFKLLRHRRNEPQAFLYAFDLLEVNGTDLRREPIEVRGVASPGPLTSLGPAAPAGSVARTQ